MKMNNIMVPVGDPRGQTQTTEASLTDMDTGEVYKVMGNQTVLIQSNQLDKTIEANFPGMDYVHKRLDVQSSTYPYARNREIPGRSPATALDIPAMSDITFIKDDPGVYYRSSNGNVASGAAIHSLYKKGK
jgi:hypothetical protein